MCKRAQTFLKFLCKCLRKQNFFRNFAPEYAMIENDSLIADYTKRDDMDRGE